MTGENTTPEPAPSPQSFLARKNVAVGTALFLAGAVTVFIPMKFGGGSDDAKPAKDGGSASSEQAAAKRSIFESKGDMVTIAVKKGQPGFSTRDGDEYEYIGFERNLVSYLADDIGFDADPRDVPSMEREKILVNGGAELVVGTYTVTGTRDKQVDFTIPYFKTDQAILVREDYDGIEEYGDIDGKRVCTVRNSTADPDSEDTEEGRRLIKRTLGKNVLPGYEKDYKSCVKQLMKNDYDVVWTDRIILEGFDAAPTYADRVRIVDDIKIPNTTPQFYGIAINEGHRSDCLTLNKTVRKFLTNRWVSAFSDFFPTLAEGNFQSEYRPTDDEVAQAEPSSCGGKR